MNPTTIANFENPTSHARHPKRWIWGPIGVFRHELMRTLTFGRTLTWMAMAFFPPTLIGIASWQVGARADAANASELYFGYAFLLFLLIPQVLTVLGMLLWATPIVHSELEAQTWVYAVVRPGARRGVLIGKYCVAVLWTFSSACLAVSLAVPVSGIASPFKTWQVLCFLNLISAMSYAALFVTIGILVQKRAMVTAFLYAFFIEAILSTLPATINQLTISYRLRSILFQLLDLNPSAAKELGQFFDTSTSVPMHLLCLCGLVSSLLGISLWRVQANQFVWQSET
ncbi:MAG: hypothetical protein ABL921_07530 [Pirellula sp.]